MKTNVLQDYRRRIGKFNVESEKKIHKKMEHFAFQKVSSDFNLSLTPILTEELWRHASTGTRSPGHALRSLPLSRKQILVFLFVSLLVLQGMRPALAERRESKQSFSGSDTKSIATIGEATAMIEVQANHHGSTFLPSSSSIQQKPLKQSLTEEAKRVRDKFWKDLGSAIQEKNFSFIGNVGRSICKASEEKQDQIIDDAYARQPDLNKNLIKVFLEIPELPFKLFEKILIRFNPAKKDSCPVSGLKLGFDVQKLKYLVEKFPSMITEVRGAYGHHMHNFIMNEKTESLRTWIGIIKESSAYHKNLFKELLQVKDGEGYTPLMRAVQVCSLDMVTQLLALDKDSVNEVHSVSGLTAAHFAVNLGQVEIVQALKTVGARFDIQAKDGFYPADYLFIPRELVEGFLRAAAIEPRRDENALLNHFSDLYVSEHFMRHYRLTEAVPVSPHYNKQLGLLLLRSLDNVQKLRALEKNKTNLPTEDQEELSKILAKMPAEEELSQWTGRSILAACTDVERKQAMCEILSNIRAPSQKSRDYHSQVNSLYASSIFQGSKETIDCKLVEAYLQYKM